MNNVSRLTPRSRGTGPRATRNQTGFYLREGVSYFDVFSRRDLGAQFPVGETSWSRCSRSAGPLGGFQTRIRAGVPRVVHRQAGRFRSFRSLMSIEKRVGPFQGPLGP